MNNKIKRALFSVTNKIGLIDFAKELNKMGVTFISTNGTANLLKNNGFIVTKITDITGFPEILNGRIKSLHPRIYGGILACRNNPNHLAELTEHNINLLDLVCVNLYNFENIITKKDCILSEAIENIDIGGPSLIRASAKNYKYITIVTDPTDYPNILNEMRLTNGLISLNTRKHLATKAFRLTYNYDKIINKYFEKYL